MSSTLNNLGPYSISVKFTPDLDNNQPIPELSKLKMAM